MQGLLPRLFDARGPRRAALLAVALAGLLAVPVWSADALETPVVAAVKACDELRAAPDVDPLALAPLAPASPEGHDFSFETCTGMIRPGARVSSPYWCTLNFIYDDAEGNLYTGTAGHCVDRVGQRVAAEGVGWFGTVVYLGLHGSMDFALVLIDEDKHEYVNPTMCAWGGPLGAQDPGSNLPNDAYFEYGWGIATYLTAETRARAHAETESSASFIWWTGVGSGGDSGAPVVNQAGYAVGIHTRGITPVAGVAYEGGPSIGALLSAARTVVPTLELVPGDTTSLEDVLGEHTYA